VTGNNNIHNYDDLVDDQMYVTVDRDGVPVGVADGATLRAHYAAQRRRGDVLRRGIRDCLSWFAERQGWDYDEAELLFIGAGYRLDRDATAHELLAAWYAASSMYEFGTAPRPYDDGS
jgi:hypothetical protein